MDAGAAKGDVLACSAVDTQAVATRLSRCVDGSYKRISESIFLP
jgi:hypothetical protein